MHASFASLSRLAAIGLWSFALVVQVGETAVAQDAEATPADATGGQQQQMTTEQIQAKLTEADEALKAGEFQRALEIFDPFMRSVKAQQVPNPQAVALFATGRGQALVGLEEYEAALADFNEALQAQDKYLPALLARGKLYLDLGGTDTALADFQAAVEQDRGNVEALFGLGKAYVLLGGSQQAIKPLSNVIAKNDQNAEAFRLRAQAYAGVAKFKEAYEDMERAMSVAPEDHENEFALGTIYLREKKYEESAKAFQDAIEHYKPKKDSEEPYIQGYLTVAAALCELGKEAKHDENKNKAYKEAELACDKLLELLGDSPIYAQARAAAEFRRGVALRLQGKLGDAINAMTEAINLNPELGEAYFRRGICFYNLDEDKLAVADFQKAALITFDDPRARLWEGFTFAKLGEYYEAVRAYGLALAESDRYVPAYVNRGLAYMKLQDYKKALADFNEAIRIEPTQGSHYLKRGLAYEQMGDYQLAADSFVNAARFDEHNATAFRHAAGALRRLGRNELAGEYRSKADELEAAKKKPQ